MNYSRMMSRLQSVCYPARDRYSLGFRYGTLPGETFSQCLAREQFHGQEQKIPLGVLVFPDVEQPANVRVSYLPGHLNFMS